MKRGEEKTREREIGKGMIKRSEDGRGNCKVKRECRGEKERMGREGREEGSGR